MLNNSEKNAGESLEQAETPRMQQGSNVTDEQQDYYDIFVSQGIKLIGKVAPSIKERASINTLGELLFNIVNKIEISARKNGIEFPFSVLVHGTGEILGHLIDATDVQISKKQVKAVIGIAVGMWVENAYKTGRMTKEQLAKLAQEAQQFGANIEE